jgi:hypothetical protein
MLCFVDWNNMRNLYGSLRSSFRCAVYTGPCDTKCEAGCTGPDGLSCFENACVPHATLEADGCNCDNDWSGLSCELYTGPCLTECFTCSSASTCQICVPNAYRNSVGNCICVTGYSGTECKEYAGACAINCADCLDNGHTVYDCNECNENAHFNEFGECVCDKDFSAYASCALYSGRCANHCAQCEGPNADECTACESNANGILN